MRFVPCFSTWGSSDARAPLPVVLDSLLLWIWQVAEVELASCAFGVVWVLLAAKQD